MKIALSKEEKESLKKRHRVERDGRIRDRMKAILLKDIGWSEKQIAQALFIHEETLREHLKDWRDEQKLKPENGGSQSKLDDAQTKALDRHLTENTYARVEDICVHVQNTYGVLYTVSGMTKWLQQHHFSYKEPKKVPAKLDVAMQNAFQKKYSALKEKTPKDQPILFMDSAHPTMATKTACGWIKKGQAKLIAQTASRTRVNITGAIELSSMKVVSSRPDKVNSETVIAFFDKLKVAYPEAKRIHVILDQSGYHRSEALKKAAKKRKIRLHYLPPYSPNLNPIERLWKVFSKRVRNNIFFQSAKEFRHAIDNFFDVTFPEISESLRETINDNFQKLRPASSS